MRLLIKNAKVVMLDKIRIIRNVILENGKITNLTDSNQNLGAFDTVIETNEQYLMPGFIDIHMHGNSGVDIMESDRNSLTRIAKYQLSRGVTAFLGATISADKTKLFKVTEKITDYVKSQETDVSELLGLYLEGPFFNPERKGAHSENYLRQPDLEEMKSLLDKVGGVIKVVSLAPELEGADELISYLARKNVKIALGHTEATYETAMKAIRMGASIATHLFNAMSPLKHREPGVVGACLDSPRIFAELIADGVHLHDAVIRLTCKCKGAERVVLISDQIRAAGLPDGDYTLAGEKIRVIEGVARTLEGNLAGSTGDLFQGFRRLVDKIGIKLEDAVRMVTFNPAKAIGIHKIMGNIDIGMQADLLLLNKDLGLEMVIKKGKVVYTN